MSAEIELSRYAIPYTPFRSRLTEASVCLVTTAGVRTRRDVPFDAAGDLSYRTIPGDATAADLIYDDEHYDHACVDRDINCVFPIDRIREIARGGRIGGVASAHFSMGFSQALAAVRSTTIPPLVKDVERVRPDVVLLTGG